MSTRRRRSPWTLLRPGREGPRMEAVGDCRASRYCFGRLGAYVNVLRWRWPKSAMRFDPQSTRDINAQVEGPQEDGVHPARRPENPGEGVGGRSVAASLQDRHVRVDAAGPGLAGRQLPRGREDRLHAGAGQLELRDRFRVDDQWPAHDDEMALIQAADQPAATDLHGCH